MDDFVEMVGAGVIVVVGVLMGALLAIVAVKYLYGAWTL